MLGRLRCCLLLLQSANHLPDPVAAARWWLGQARRLASPLVLRELALLEGGGAAVQAVDEIEGRSLCSIREAAGWR